MCVLYACMCVAMCRIEALSSLHACAHASRIVIATELKSAKNAHTEMLFHINLKVFITC